ncbi:MAG TPA: hypothetical protein VNK94_00360 [Gaiellaceae bacterium]|jgi:hypothetical protein|nr:hypothetical protein [Gaiellaceae bacterium]
MRAAEQWEAIAASLPPGWAEAELSFVPEDPRETGAAAAVLAPLGPGRSGGALRFRIAREGGDQERLRNLLERLDRKRIWGELALLAAREEAPRPKPAPAAARPGLAQAWDAALAELPPGWSDLLCELTLDSSDLLPRAALLCAPLNPARNPGAVALRFRVSARRGYGTSPGMTRRCLERLDAERISGRLAVLDALADADDGATQGPVWRVAGRSV